MKTFKTLVTIEGENKLYECDTIVFQGKKWLVPEWSDTLALKLTTPVRIILLDSLPHQKAGPQYQVDFVLNSPIPKSVWNGSQTQVNGAYVVIEKPDVSQDGKMTRH